MSRWLRRLLRRSERLSALPANRHLPDRVKAVIDTWEFQESTRRGLADFERFRRAYAEYRAAAEAGRHAEDPRD